MGRIPIKNTRSRILLGNLLIPLLILCLFVASSTYFLNYIKNENERRSNEILESAARNFDEEVIRLKGLMTLCKKDPSFILALSNRLPFHEYHAYAMDASDILTTIDNSLPYAINTFAMVRGNQNVILTDRFLEKEELFLKSLKKQMEEYEVLPDLEYLEDGFYSFAKFALFVTNVENYGSVIIQLNLWDFCRLDEFSGAFEGWDIVVLNEQDRYFTSNHTESVEIQNINWSDYYAITEAELFEEESLIWHTKAPISEFNFVLFKPISSIEKVFTSINIIVIIVILIGAGLCIWLIVFNYHKFLELFRVANKHGGDRQEDVPSFFDRRLYELKTENTNLARELNVNKEKEIDAILCILIYNKELTYPVPPQIHKQYNSYCVLCIAAQDEYGNGAASIFDQLDRYLFDIYGYKSLPYRPMVKAYLLHANTDVEDSVLSIQQHFEGLRFMVYMGLSPVSNDIFKLSETADAAYEVMKSTLVVPGRTVAKLQKTLVPSKSNIGVEQLEKITNCVQNEDSEKIKNVIRSMVFPSEPVTLGSMITDYNILMAAMETLERSLNIEVQHKGISKSKTELVFHPEFIVHRLCEECMNLNNLVSNSRQHMKYPVLEHINEHYTEELSIDSIASVFGITPPYLSSWFKKTTGVNLTAYISMVRMRAVKRMMVQDPSIRNKDLAKRSGFTSTTTFIRQFRNFFGVTPEKYRQSLAHTTETLIEEDMLEMTDRIS